jgi:hypothetical protein
MIVPNCYRQECSKARRGRWMSWLVSLALAHGVDYADYADNHAPMHAHSSSSSIGMHASPAGGSCMHDASWSETAGGSCMHAAASWSGTAGGSCVHAAADACVRKKCRVNLASNGSGWSNVPVLIYI